MALFYCNAENYFTASKRRELWVRQQFIPALRPPGEYQVECRIASVITAKNIVIIFTKHNRVHLRG